MWCSGNLHNRWPDQTISEIDVKLSRNKGDITSKRTTKNGGTERRSQLLSLVRKRVVCVSWAIAMEFRCTMLIAFKSIRCHVAYIHRYLYVCLCIWLCRIWHMSTPSTENGILGSFCVAQTPTHSLTLYFFPSFHVLLSMIEATGFSYISHTVGWQLGVAHLCVKVIISYGFNRKMLKPKRMSDFEMISYFRQKLAELARNWLISINQYYSELGICVNSLYAVSFIWRHQMEARDVFLNNLRKTRTEFTENRTKAQKFHH